MENLIYTWSCEGKLSRVYYSSKQKTFNAVTKRFRLPQSFGIPEFVNTENEPLLNFIKEKLKYSLTKECESKAKNGVYNCKKDIEFYKKLKNIMKELDNDKD